MSDDFVQITVDSTAYLVPTTTAVDHHIALTSALTLTNPTQAQVDAVPRNLKAALTISVTSVTPALTLAGFHGPGSITVTASATPAQMTFDHCTCPIILNPTAASLSIPYVLTFCTDVTINSTSANLLIQGTDSSITFNSSACKATLLRCTVKAWLCSFVTGSTMDYCTITTDNSADWSNMTQQYTIRGATVYSQPTISLTNPTQAQIDALGTNLTGALSITWTEEPTTNILISGLIWGRSANVHELIINNQVAWASKTLIIKGITDVYISGTQPFYSLQLYMCNYVDLYANVSNQLITSYTDRVHVGSTVTSIHEIVGAQYTTIYWDSDSSYPGT